MEPLRASQVNSKYYNKLHSSRALTIPINRCDNEVFNRVIKEEFIDNTDHMNENQLLQTGPKCEFEEEINPSDPKIKIEKDLNDGYVFQGSVKNECHSSELSIHMNSDNTSNLSKTFSNLNDFKVNYKLQTNNNNQKRNISDELLFNSKAYFTRHSKIQTRKIKKRFVCDNCKKSYSPKSDLITHILCCTGAKLYKTDICDKGFSQAGLKKDKRTHTGLKSYKCDICDKRFIQSGCLKKHKRTHSSEKPYVCDICDKRFTVAVNLKIHKRTHSGEEPFVSDICDKGFTVAVNLKIHKRTHSGEKPYGYDICDKANKVNTHGGGLKKHKRTHTGTKPYTCHICDISCSTKSNLTKHLRTHTGVKL